MTQAALSKDATQYVTMGIDGEIFAAEVEGVREILDMRPVSRIPNAPPFMMGMIDVRGQGVVVIDLRVKLGLPAVAPTEDTRIVVMEVDVAGRTRLMGLVADKVFEVTPLEEQAFESPPEVGVRWRSDYIRGISRRGGAFVIIFDLARLFSTDEAALVGAAG
ncbi:MAG TPA: chemotaxis protein CheW [Azospirillum sp.]|nr:chemotaxis protein CheW [Azospirillum sp.]